MTIESLEKGVAIKDKINSMKRLKTMLSEGIWGVRSDHAYLDSIYIEDRDELEKIILNWADSELKKLENQFKAL
jgi:hypothetical protein